MATSTVTKATGSYQVTSWDEKPYDEHPEAVKLTKARFTSNFTGDIEGEGTAEYLMAYPTEQTASFVGIQRVVGTLGGRKGTFVLQASGTFGGGKATAEWFVVPESATGELKGLTGRGGYESGSDGTAKVTLEYELA